MKYVLPVVVVMAYHRSAMIPGIIVMVCPAVARTVGCGVQGGVVVSCCGSSGKYRPLGKPAGKSESDVRSRGRSPTLVVCRPSMGGPQTKIKLMTFKSVNRRIARHARPNSKCCCVIYTVRIHSSSSVCISIKISGLDLYDMIRKKKDTIV